MPFSSLRDPIDIARAQRAMEAAWAEIKPTVPPDALDRERLRLVYIVTALANRTGDQSDLTQLAIERYQRAIRAEGRG